MDKKNRKSYAKRRSARDKLPENFDIIEELWEFWDKHSSADYEDVMKTVETEIDLSSSKMYCAISQRILDASNRS